MKKLLYLIILVCAFHPFEASAVNLTSHKLSSVNGLPDNNIRHIEQDSTGFLILQSVFALYRYDGYTFRKLPQEAFETFKNKVKGSSLTGHDKSYTYDNLGNKILTETGGNTILYMDYKTGEEIPLTVFTDELRQLSKSLKCMVITDERGLIWVSVNGNGLFVYDRNSRELDHIMKGDGRGLIDSNYIVYMMEDRDGNIWVSQEHYGLACITVEKGKYEILNLGKDYQAEKENEVRLMKLLSDGTIILCNNRGRLIRTDSGLNGLGNMQLPPVQLGLGDNYNSAELDAKGRLWLGSLKRGVRIGNEWHGSGRIDCILKDSKDRMWTCSLDGDVMLASLDDNNHYSERHFLSDIPELRPRTMIQDHQGTIWVGADKGLFAFQPDELLKNPKSYRQVSEVPTRCLMEDHQHQLWTGTTERGLARLNADGTFTYITREDGLPNDVVQFITEDARHHLCIGTQDGCANYNLENGEIHCLYFNNNKIRNFYNADCGLQLPDGRMAFGSLDGIILIEKNVDVKWHRHSQNVVTNLLIDGVSIYDMGEDSPVKGDISTMKAISLKHDQNSLTIHFSNFDFSHSHLAGYTYKLEGFDKEWSKLSKLGSATYKDLKPGNYTLYVRYHDEGGWDSEEKLLDIEIHPAPWDTWWAWSLYLLIFLLIGYLIYHQIRTMGRLHQRLALERQLTEYKLRFFTNISHEFRTPLTLIKGAMEKIGQAKEIVPSNIKQPLSNMEQSTNRLLRLINQLLEFRRIQNNKLTLTLAETDIVKFIYDIYIGFHDIADNRHITYTFTPFKKSYMMYIDQGHVDKIIYNLISNAFKYTPERETISVNIRQDESGQVLISVTDTGIGVSAEKQAELFDRFSTGRVSGDSIGIGLNMSQELARVHHGEISYQENVPKGSVFTLTLPSDKTIYKETDFLKTETGLEVKQPQERQGFVNNYREVKAAPLNPQRVLVAEDNAELSVMIKDELSVYFEVDCVSNGMEALEQLKASVGEEGPGYDLLVSDVMMPIMNGFELTRRIRADKALSSLPVFLLTALSGEEQQQKGLEVGADAYLEKPFSPQLLTSQAINLIEQRSRLKTVFAQQPQKPVVKELIHNDADKKFLLQMDAFIDSHMSDYNLSVDVIAAHFDYGRTRFYNKVRNLTGKTPNDYLKEKRLNKAAELLRESSAITVAEVAYQVGINNPHYFAVNFKKAFGITPSAYQRGKSPTDPASTSPANES